MITTRAPHGGNNTNDNNINDNNTYDNNNNTKNKFELLSISESEVSTDFAGKFPRPP